MKQQDIRHARQVREDEPSKVERHDRAVSAAPVGQEAGVPDRKLTDGELEHVVGGFLRACLPKL